MFQTLKNAWKIPELKNKLLFTLLIIVLYRLGSAIPLPWVNSDTLQSWFSSQGGNALGWLNVLSGGALSRATLFALSVSPYITASIVVQLLTIAIPKFTDWSKEGESGQKKLSLVTRWLTVVLALVTAVGYTLYISNSGMVQTYKNTWENVVVKIVLVACYCAGAALIMWLAERINEFGIGNGISIILFAGILSRVPSMVSGMSISLKSGAMQWWHALLVVIGILALIVLITWVNGAERRIPVQYAKRQVGRKMYGGQASTLPMKVNMSGVLPIIFAQSIAMIIPTVAAFLPAPEKGTFAYTLVNAVDSKSVLYMIVYFLMIIAFSYFYATIQFNPVEISNNLKKNGGFIPGFRPGKPTADFIKKVLNKVTLFGAIYLGVVAILPLLIGKIVNVPSLSIGGTSVIIVVGVALETVQALESQMLMRQYKGFLE